MHGLHPVGPPLTALRSKLADPRWLIAWLLHPARLRPQPLMRALHLRPEEAQSIAAYLLDTPPPPAPSVTWRGGNARAGEKLFTTRGCRGCHAIGKDQKAPVSYAAPNLAGIGIKVRGDWLFEWLRSPRSYNPNTAMPKLALKDGEIRDLVAFLLSHREGAGALAAAPPYAGHDDPEMAKTAILRFDCTKCHLIRGFQTVEPSNGWSLVPRVCAPCHEQSAITLLPTPNDQKAATAAALRDGRRLVAYYRCRGCHRIEGNGGAIAEHFERKTLAPPSLEDEGARVQASWLVDFLQHPKELRPWLRIRKPDYALSETDARAIARYFAIAAHAPQTDEAVGVADAAKAALGARRFAHFKCVQCHPADGEKPPPDVDPDDLSIDLMRAKKRLRPSWVRDFLARPKALVGVETRMPAVFYTSDGIPKVEHPRRDIDAITTHLMHMTEPPSSNHAEQKDEPPIIDWATEPY